MIEQIGHGDKIKCLNCGKPILINEKTFKFDDIGEYIVCPNCNKCYNVDFYNYRGEKIFSAKTKIGDYCEKCGEEAKHFISSATYGVPTLKLCEKCYIEHEEWIRQKENEFLGKEFYKKRY